jgi:molecular chaperone GrpE
MSEPDPAVVNEEGVESVDVADSSVPDEPETSGGAIGDAAEPEDPVAVAQRERDEYLDHLRRERAEFENFRKRATKERMDALDRGAEQIVSNLLHVLDTFGFALAAAQDRGPDDNLAKGVEMVYAELVDVLHKAGLEQVAGVGSPFDPMHHEAMMQVEADQPTDEPVVVEVLRPGYRFKGRVLRPASVKVAK